MTEDERNDSMAPEAEQPEESADGAEEVEAADRMPGLWVVCVLLALAGVFSASLAVLATPTGRVVFGAVAGLDLAVAVGLWRRWSVAWYAGLALVGAKAACWIVEYGSGLPAAPWAIGAVALNVCIAAYLILRRPAFAAGPKRRPCLAGPPAIVAAVLVVGVGAVWWWVVFADIPGRRYPPLMTGYPTGRGANAFSSLKSIMAQCKPVEQTDEIERLLKDPPARYDAADAAWTKQARAVIERNAAWLKLADAMAKAPQFNPPRVTPGGKWYGRDISWLKGIRATALFLSLASDVHLVDGDAKGAMDLAQMAVMASLAPAGRADSLATYLAGADAAALGLEQVRTVAAHVDGPKQLQESITALPTDEISKGGMEWAWGAEFRNDSALAAQARDMDVFMSLDRPDHRGPFGRMIKSVPFVKPNMTCDVLGRAMADYVRKVQGRPPWDNLADVLERVTGVSDMANALGWLHLVRNGMGDVLALQMLAGKGDSLQRHLALVADLRLTRLDLAARAYQLKEGKLPAKLSDLAPAYIKAVPVDPFSGSPFGYEPTGAQPRIWSAGPDQRTDPAGTKEGDDIVVPLAAAAKEAREDDGGESDG